MLKFTAKFNTLDFSSFEKVCSVLKNNGWTFSEEPVFMFGLCIITVSIEHSSAHTTGDFELSQIIDAIECTSDCTICSINVIENTQGLGFTPFEANWETSSLPNTYIFQDESFENPETGETIHAWRNPETGEWMY